MRQKNMAAGEIMEKEAAQVQEQETAEGQAQSDAPKTRRRKQAKSLGSYLAKIAMMAALSFGISLLEFPLFPAAPFLKLDFSSFVPLIGGFALGPVAGVIISLVKEALCVIKSSTGGVGQIANFIINTAFILVPTVAYRFRRKFSTVLLALPVGCVLEIGAALLSNRYINFPLFMGGGAAAAFASLWGYIVAFNAVKCVAVSVICLLLYKKVGWLLRRF